MWDGGGDLAEVTVPVTKGAASMHERQRGLRRCRRRKGVRSLFDEKDGVALSKPRINTPAF